MTTETETFDHVKHALDGVKPRCLAALSTMRGFIDQAEHLVNDERTTPEDAIGHVIHKFAWGSANATGHITNALASLNDARAIAANLAAKETVK